MSPRTAETAPGRTLVQLGLPTPNAVTLWHLCPSEDLLCTVTVSTEPKATAIEPSKIIDGGRRIMLKGFPAATGVTATVTTNWNAGGKPLTRVDSLVAATAPAVDAPADFSFIASSCNELLHVDDRMDGKQPALHVAQLNSLNLLRLRAEAKLRIDRLPPRPAFILGLGDQVYMDAEWEDDKTNRGFSLFTGKRSNVSRFAMASDEKYFAQEISRRTFATPPLDRALRAVPFVSVWDDHELRDGFRNQNDETDDVWKQWYTAARSAYVRDQVLRNPQAEATELPPHASTAVEFSWGKNSHFFVLESRSAEGLMVVKESGKEAPEIAAHRVFGREQWSAFTKWLALHADPKATPSLIVVGIPTPLTVAFGDLGVLLSGFDGELKDDLMDQLPSTGAHFDLAALLAQTFANSPHRLLILSGDIHSSSVTRLKVKGRAIGLEVVSSGIAASRGLKDKMATYVEGPTSIGRLNMMLDAEPAGTLRGTPSFAEIRVRTQGNDAPLLEVFFFPSQGNPIDPVESERLANPAAYFESHPGVWASRRYAYTDAATAPQVAFVGFPDVADAGSPTSRGYNLLHAGASVCLDYPVSLKGNPYFGTEWFSVSKKTGQHCSILPKGPDLAPAPLDGGS